LRRAALTALEPGGGPEHHFDVRKFIVVLALLAAGCSGGGHTLAASRLPWVPLSAQLVLPSQTMTAGSIMPARVVMQNNTGRAISVNGCGGVFAIGLVNSTYRQGISWPLCLQRFTFPTGQSTWRAFIEARYTECRPCADGQPPPLPPGDYQAVLYQSPPGHIVPEPPAVTVRVTA
jgi:hypothetical protein